MKRKTIKFLQSQLNGRGLDAGPEDGILGPRTIRALEKNETISSQWSRNRKAVGFLQLLAREYDIETGPIDGYWGPQTEFAFDSLQTLLAEGKAPEIWRPEDIRDVNPNNWPREKPEASLMERYGKIGENQVRIELPYPQVLAWKKTEVIQSFLCHELVHDSLEKVLTRVLDHYGLEEIRRLRLDLWGGCLNMRKKRRGSSRSTHSWGIALDYDPERNKLNWGRDRAAFAKSEYNTWWRLWEEEGWVSLGRQRNFDWMHVQAAKI